MRSPHDIDSVLAFLDWLEGYRRSWRCWLIGGPAAVDEIGVAGLGESRAVDVRLGGISTRFSIWHTGHRVMNRFLGLEPRYLCTPLNALALTCLCLVHCGLFAAALSGLGVMPGIGRHDSNTDSTWKRQWMRCRALAPFAKHILASCFGRRRPATIAIVGPDADACADLHALLAHLAGMAQAADPAQGGRVLDDYADLSARLLPEPHLVVSPSLQMVSVPRTPRWSSTYRIRFGRAVAGGGLARVVQVVCPEGGPDVWCRRLFRRADHVWLVLPAGTSDSERERWLREAGDAIGAGKGRLTLIQATDGGGAPVGLPDGTSRLNLDLTSLRERYLSGMISPEDAAGLVQQMLALDPAGAGRPALPAALEAGEDARRRTMGGEHEHAG